ncbi:DNA repair and recombination protein RAD26 [Spathaspora sp. JA1]|nr:DNA repair and recombination protein RAD26 [Spathaspora sp. JA1]
MSDESQSNEPLKSLGIKLVDQNELETSITRKANVALIQKDAELDQKRLEKAIKDLNTTTKQIDLLNKRLHNPRTKISERKSIRDEIAWFETNELEQRQRDVEEITARLEESKSKLTSGGTDGTNVSGRLPDETEKDFLIRTGKITAFGNENEFQQDDESAQVQSHVFLRQPGFEGEVEEIVDVEDNDEDYEYKDVPVEEEIEEEEQAEKEDFKNLDDGDESIYQSRLLEWCRKRSSLRQDDPNPELEEWSKPHPTISDAILNSQFKLPGDIYPSLFDYQKTCVQWLWELYSQKTGGIIGDEMGLGKTIQIISFIAGLHYSGLLDKPVLVVVPATVLNQWVNEFHKWWPPLRCIILHSIGSGMGEKVSESKLETFLESHDPNASTSSLRGIKSQINAQEIIDRVVEKGHVLITTYVGLRIYSKHILPREWGYVILDEGHKIRNPDSDISLTCKQIKTYNRIILSGTPIQNNLIELWSLFDFIFPGRLGTLPVFQQQFSIPINMGGYANASNIQVQTGYKCAVILRDLITPYLLRRLKSDVAQDLPKKNEMVLFVKLTRVQQDLYEKFLHSEELTSILKGKRNVLMGVDILRKICNHPDLVNRDILMYKKGYNYGDPAKSGKMQVLKNLLQLWQSQDHKTLLFCQTRQMLDILEKFVANLSVINQEDSPRYFNYLRMDGGTPIGKRQLLVDKFNNDPNQHVFLLTTKVGGLGVNLTGADRVIIYDPDWNPSTDIQARERAWRLGQKRDITIYRLMTTGSIEEKIYHRQIFKTFLTNKILKDPKQRRFFKINDLHDLFTLGDQNEQGTETGDLFTNSEVKFGGTKQRKQTSLFKKKHKNDDDFYQVAKISGVAKLDQYVDEKEQDEPEAKDNDDDRVMQGIFTSSGVHSTLKHDDIIDSSNQETSLIEREANKIANAAAEALKKSRKLARKKEIGVPTWTGKFGLAGKFGPKKKSVKPSPSSSTAILENLKRKNESDGLFQKKVSSEQTLDRDVIIGKLVDWLQKQPDNFSTSNEIMKNINVKLTLEKDIILLRSMLREIAVWDNIRKGWKLKDVFSV